jgi:hypothetical protein
MKALFILVVALALIALVVAVVWLAIDNARLRRRMKGLDEPELWLPRAERRAHARKLLKREDEAYEQQMISRLTEVINRGNQPNLEQGR